MRLKITVWIFESIDILTAHGGHDADIMEALSQRIHDYSIDTAIKELLGFDDASGLTLRKAVGIMGGHLATRDDLYYRKTVEVASLTHGAGCENRGGPAAVLSTTENGRFPFPTTT